MTVSRMFAAWRSALVVMAMLLTSATYAQPAAGVDLLERPSAGGAADVVSVHFTLLDIVDIDDKAQRFEIDAYVELRWQDPRLALPGSGEHVRLMTLDEIWTPGLAILNDRGLEPLLPEVARVSEGGQVVVRRRLAGPLAVDLKLHDFPYDRQVLTVDVLSYLHGPDEVQYAQDSELVSNPDTFSADGWGFEVLPPERSEFRVREGARGAPEISFRLMATRDSGFYVFTLLMPMTLIMLMTWMVHWLPPQLSPPRLGTASAAVFSVIAFGVSLRLSLPQVGYLTVADKFVIFSIIMVGISLAVAVLVARLVDIDRLDRALSVSRFMRWAFPLTFIAAMLLTRLN
ncbi:hypothetical protein F3N42_06895 [Marinihelvus fidelis]|uniref:Neurotransmitter-gated ion-channel ligand-binding domain-containing protein n=1 Tax=Marinihelvus fidelis TaxID=2613842 RepID=A0A5N0TCV6_9GAMM|nr:hypothetical protein [Marinihelvus fidelis]KAA9131897.1 hypothetical protein F3N42_06895 [Marinihelvus fidelis]